ncbi:MAG: ATP-binding protein [Coriobacteriia bacterium]|nr:ATP-binding protein [Coriobacteriia bacterium]
MSAAITNPFNPQFGKRPTEFIGRDIIVNDFLQSMDNPEDPHRVSIITGIRGTGKTAILADIRQNLDPKKYLVINLTARDGMLLDMLDIAARDGKPWVGDLFDDFAGFSVGALGFSISISRKNGQEEHGFRYYLTDIVSHLTKKGITTVFLVDEVHNETPDMREFVVTFQHLLMEDMNVALLMAGLPSSVQDVLNDQVLTFLRRAQRVELESIDSGIVANAYEDAFDKASRSFGGGALRQAAKASCGYPYLIQLIGFYLWKRERNPLTGADVKKALTASKIELFRNVHDLIYRDLSPKDKEFLMAMSQDTGESDISDVMLRMQADNSYISRYRQRMIDAGIIHSVGRGKLAFSPPYIREYLLDKNELEWGR